MLNGMKGEVITQFIELRQKLRAFILNLCTWIKEFISLQNICIWMNKFKWNVYLFFSSFSKSSGRQLNIHFSSSEQQQKMYSELFNVFGSTIRTIEANGMRNIDDNHWFFQLLNEHAPNFERICFKNCLFRYVDDIYELTDIFRTNSLQQTTNTTIDCEVL